MSQPNVQVNPVTYQNLGVVSAFQLIPAGMGSVNVYNGDTTNILLVSPSPTPQLSNSMPVQPLTNAEFSGQQGALYASAMAGTVATVTVSNAQLSPSPAQIAAQISALGLATYDEQVNQNTEIPTNISTTGAPLLNLYNLLEGFSQTIGAGTSVTKGPFSIGQISYEFVIEVGTTQNAAIAPCSIQFQWTDSDTGLPTATQVYNVYAAYTGGGGNAHLIEGHGPSNSDTLTITITAVSVAVAVNVAILQSSRNYLRHEWRTQNPAGNISFPTMTYVSCAPAVNILAAESVNIAASGNQQYLLPLYTGSCILSGTTTNDIDGLWQIRDTLTSLAYVVLAQTLGPNTGPVEIALPRDQCILELGNNDTVAQFVNVAIIAEEIQTS